MPPFRRWFILVFSFFFVFRLVFTLNLLDAISLIPRLCFHPFVGMGTVCVCAHIIDDLFSFSFFFSPLSIWFHEGIIIIIIILLRVRFFSLHIFLVSMIDSTGSTLFFVCVRALGFFSDCYDADAAISCLSLCWRYFFGVCVCGMLRGFGSLYY